LVVLIADTFNATPAIFAVELRSTPIATAYCAVTTTAWHALPLSLPPVTHCLSLPSVA
jgi:hypothetical protein